MLLNVVNEGTAHRVRSRYGLTAEMGGKTGTTNFNADGWFMGFTPQIVTGTWVGGDERFIHFNSMANGQGAAMALPIYGLFMKKVYADKSLPFSESARFNFPASINLCEKDYYGAVGDEAPEPTVEEESIEGVFD